MESAKSSNFLYREVVKKLKPFMERDEIIVVFGARQVGKTSLLRYLEERLREEGKRTYFIDLEDIELRESIKSAQGLIVHLKALGFKPKERSYIFLDEFHYMKNATSILKYLHDHYPELKFIVTGSSSLKLKFRMEESLTGRKAVFLLYPLSFQEFLTFSGREELKSVLERFQTRPLPEPFSSQLLKVYEEYILYGGYPKVALTPSYEMKQEILKEIQTTYVEKEIRSLIREENFSKFRSLVEFLGAQNGGLLKILEVSKEIGIPRDTVQRYITILEETFIIHRIRPWARSRQKEITRTPKVYFYDTGFLNFTLKDFRPLSLRQDAGRLVETSVCTAILRNLRPIEELNFFRTKSGNEVNFILRRGREVIPIEVKWGRPIKTPPPMRKYIEREKPKRGYLICKDFKEEEKIGRCKVKPLLPWGIEYISPIKGKI